MQEGSLSLRDLGQHKVAGIQYLLCCLYLGDLNQVRSELCFPLTAEETDAQRGPWLAQVHTASKWQNWESNPGPIDSRNC